MKLRTLVFSILALALAMIALGQPRALMPGPMNPAWLSQGAPVQSGGGSSYTPNATLFNDAAITRTSPLNGAVASSTLIFSAWVKFNDSISGNFFLDLQDSSGDDEFRVGMAVGDGFIFQEVGPGTYWFFATATMPTTGVWYHILACTDSSSADNCHLYINDVDQGPPTSGVTGGDFTWETYPNWSIPQNLTSSFSLSELFVAPNQYLDFSNASNRAKFSSGGQPVSLGATGSLPTGTPPLIYLPNPYTSFGTDASGNGNNFSVTTGSLANDPSLP